MGGVQLAEDGTPVRGDQQLDAVDLVGSSGIRFSVPGMVPPITHSVGAVPVFNRTVMRAEVRSALTGKGRRNLRRPRRC